MTFQRQRLFTTSFAAIALAVTASPSQAIPVYIIAGQSNSWNIGHIAQDASTAGITVQRWRNGGTSGTSCTNSNLGFVRNDINRIATTQRGYGLANGIRTIEGSTVVLLQFSICGTSLSGVGNWYPGDDPAGGQVNDVGLYAKLITNIAAARNNIENVQGETWELKGLFWHQGESDSNTAAQLAAYETNLRNLVYRLRDDLGDELPIVVGHIREFGTDEEAINDAMDTIAADDRWLSSVSATGLKFRSPTDVHFNDTGASAMGTRMVSAMQALPSAAAASPVLNRPLAADR